MENAVSEPQVSGLFGFEKAMVSFRQWLCEEVGVGQFVPV